MKDLVIKGGIMDMLASVKDVELLEDISKFIQTTIRQKKKEEDWWDQLSSKEQKQLDEALEASYDESNWVSETEANKMIQQWLNN